MIDTHDILETINMIDNENLDVRTITMGISLLDCIDSDIDKACTKVYDKICSYAENLVKTGEDISREYGIPIVNKRIAVTPIAMLAGANPGASPVRFAKALDRAAKTVGVNFIGGYSTLVHKGFAPGDYALIESIPEALAETEFVCSSVNIGSLSKVMPSVFGVTAMSGGVKLSSASGVSSSPGVSLSLPSFSCGKFGMSGSPGSVVTP